MIIALKRIGLVFLWIASITLAMLFLIATIPITLPLFLYKTFNKVNIGEGLDSMSRELRKIAYSFDLLLNVSFFNWIDILENIHPFGIVKEPVSLVLFRRINSDTLTAFDRIVIWLILIFDKGHFNPEIYLEYENNNKYEI